MAVYTTKPENFSEMIEPFPDEIQKVAKSLRKLILNTFEEADENIYGGLIVSTALYSYKDKMKVFCGIQPHDKFCRLFLHNLFDYHSDKIKIEGSGKNARHIKVSSFNKELAEDLTKVLDTAYKNTIK